MSKLKSGHIGRHRVDYSLLGADMIGQHMNSHQTSIDTDAITGLDNVAGARNVNLS